MTLTRTAHIGGAEISYEGSVVEFDVSDGEDGPGARYVCIQYLRTDLPAPEKQARPVLFVFNGGPGSSSVWMHLGIGPRRVAAADSLEPPMTPPFELADNEHSPLDTVDLVFIDPPGTGYSRLHDAVDTTKFYSVEQDARATLEVIGQWVRRNRRESSPRFVAGESYGTLRAARIAKMANGGPFHGGTTRSTSLSGAIVLGPAFGLGESGWTGDVQTALEVPTLARSAQFHDVAPAASDDEVERFAVETLLPALVSGSRLAPTQRQEVAQRLAKYTGIDPSILFANNLRISLPEFARTLCAGENQHIGMYDSRYTLPAQNAGVDPVADDPGMGRYAPQFTGTIEQYLREELGYASDLEYRSIDFRITLSHWDYDGERVPAKNSFGDFAEALRRNPGFELLIAAGDYDLVTTLEATKYALSRFQYEEGRVHLNRYESGHMPYLGASPASQFSSDVREFIDRLSR
ncbi:hypothetical protein QBL02_03785 [Leucobacter sp. UT-8R-CII-1-4]|uniref:S10 family serine carboxypeptidase-like protein n=1 Tax=Leucobacter sp. UT-8R-CII-1-4 TaxID=3040075 RepID=UPI0024A97553|nr:hypothetical protein [Leucobacter sp. UT-8R-CII-1-4]MDI6022661.1 hypothetical protein [Leucobacter sp. UT-8R-CII-1-4]